VDLDYKIDISLECLIELALACWRAKNENLRSGSLKLNREVEKFLKRNKLEIIDMSKEEYDPGLALEVVHCDNCENDNIKIIDRMITPIITYENKVVKKGQVIIKSKKEEEK